MKWYTNSKADDVQGLICDEETGKTIAVCYDAKYAQLIASAPNLLEALKKSEMRIEQLCDLVNMYKKEVMVKVGDWADVAHDAISEVEYTS
jgi:hypothetical protein